MPSRVSAHRFSGASTTSAPHGPVVVALGDEGVERVLAGVPAGSVAAVVTQGDRVDQGHVGPDPAGDRGGDLGDLQRVGQPGPLVVTGVDHDLGLAGQPAERGRVHDPVPVPLEAGALGVRFLGPARFPRASARGWPRAAGVRLPTPPAAHRATTGPGPTQRVRGRVRPHQTGVGVTVHGPRPTAAPGGEMLLRIRRPDDAGSATGDPELGVGQLEVDRPGVVQPVLGQGHLRCAANPVARAAIPARRSGTARPGRAVASAASRSAKLEIRPSARRRSPPTGKPLKYQAMCLRISASPCTSSL